VTVAYASGREKFQGETRDWVWFDEEPPIDIYLEGLTRTNVGKNPVWMTFTPLLGVSDTVRRFLIEKSDDPHVTTMTIDDSNTTVRRNGQRSSPAIRPMNGRPAPKASPLWAPVASSRSRGNHILRAAGLPLTLAPHRRHGLRMGSPVRRGRARLGSRRGRGLCLENPPTARGDAGPACGGHQAMGKSALGVAAGWTQGNPGRRRHCTLPSGVGAAVDRQ
jgi:phage terminase large subunit-like protein